MDTYFMFLRLLICLHLLLKYSIGAGNVNWQYFYRPGSGVIFGDEFRSEYGTVSRFDCLSKCLGCHAVMFNAVTKECRHYLQQNSTIVPSGDESSVSLWISQNMKISVVKYSDSHLMTFTEAQELCVSLGGRLATYRELSNVRSAGYHLCCCGWLSDETSRLPLYYSDSTCDVQQTPRLHTCKVTDSEGRKVYKTHYSAAYCIFTV